MQDLKVLRENIQAVKQKSIVLETTLQQLELQKVDLESQLNKFNLEYPNIDNQILELEAKLNAVQVELNSKLMAVRV